MAVAASSTQLGCGRDIDHVWAHRDHTPDAHELTCPYCQAARADLTALARATQAMRDDDATNRDSEPSPQVLDRILAVARAEVRRGRRLPLDQTPSRTTTGDQTSADPTSSDPTSSDQVSVNTVSVQAVTAVIRRTGDRTRQVQIRRCAITPITTHSAVPEVAASPLATAHPASTSDRLDGLEAAEQDAAGTPSSGALDGAPAAVAVSLRVSVARDVAIAVATHQLRTAVIAAVTEEVGIDVIAVDITVEDLHDA